MSPVIELLADVRLPRDAELTKRSPRSLLDCEDSLLKKVLFSLPSGNNCRKRAASESALVQPVELEPGLVDDLSVELGLADDLPDKSSASLASSEVSFGLMIRSAIDLCFLYTKPQSNLESTRYCLPYVVHDEISYVVLTPSNKEHLKQVQS